MIKLIDRFDDLDKDEFREDLLEYVVKVAKEFCEQDSDEAVYQFTLLYDPPYDSELNDLEAGQEYETLNNKNLDIAELDNEDYWYIKDSLVKMGIDIEKFWYLLLFIDDYAYRKTKNTVKVELSEAELFRMFIESLAMEKNATNVELIVKTNGKNTLSIKDKRVIEFIASCCEIRKDEPFTLKAVSCSYEELGTPILMWVFTKMFKYFFDEYKLKTKERISVDRIIANLIHLTGIDRNKEFIGTNQYTTEKGSSTSYLQSRISGYKSMPDTLAEPYESIFGSPNFLADLD